MRVTLKLVCAAAALTTASLPAQVIAAEAITITNLTGQTLGNPPFTLGFRFTANKAIKVTGLGVFDSSQDGLTNAYSLGLWNAAGTLLGTATLASGTGTTLVNNFRYTSIAPTVLAAGQYRIGAFYANGADPLIFPGFATGFATNPAITFNESSFAGGTSLANPVFTGGAQASYFGPNFQFSAVQPVPEPEAWASMVLGLGLAGWVARRRKAKLAAA